MEERAAWSRRGTGVRRKIERRSDSQSPGIPCNIIAEYNAPHTRLARAALPHEQHLLLLGFLDLGPHVNVTALIISRGTLAGCLWRSRHVGEGVAVQIAVSSCACAEDGVEGSRDVVIKTGWGKKTRIWMCLSRGRSDGRGGLDVSSGVGGPGREGRGGLDLGGQALREINGDASVMLWCSGA